MRLTPLVFALFAASPLAAHEFWIDAESYLVDADSRLVADLVNGEDFEGGKQPYIPRRFVHFVDFADGKITPVAGRVGDNPALQVENPAPGLHVIAYQSTPLTVDYATWEAFESFVDHKDFGDVLSRHEDRELPLEDFTELYSRYSKSLIGVGDGAGADRRLGLETEIVALTNPYTDDLSGGMQFQLFYGEETRPNVQFEVLEKAPDGSVAQILYRTDDEGIATVPVKPGHEYMADAVVLREPAQTVTAASGAVWETLWANMTWGVPE
ncbi:MAG: DUF4198 domain-containing protein [Paracoccaceae bacterium]|nr:DUF4198 domain-containing protein [Loktanella sp.]